MAMGRPKITDTTIQLRVTAEQVEGLKRVAGWRELTTSAFLRKLIDQAIKGETARHEAAK
jgi:predicted DNA binding CopG/RHH family protein